MSAPRLSVVAFHLYLLLTPAAGVRVSINNAFESKFASEKNVAAVKKVSHVQKTAVFDGDADAECSIVSQEIRGLAKVFPQDLSWVGSKTPCMLRGVAKEVECQLELSPCGAPDNSGTKEACCFVESLSPDWAKQLVGFSADVGKSIEKVAAATVQGVQSLFAAPDKSELTAAIDKFAKRFNKAIRGNDTASIVSDLTSNLEGHWDECTSFEKMFYVSYLNNIAIAKAGSPAESTMLQVTAAESNQQLSNGKLEPFTIFMIVVGVVAAVMINKQQTKEQRASMFYARNIGNCDVWRGMGLTKLLRSANC